MSFARTKEITLTEKDFMYKDVHFQYFFDNAKGERCTIAVFPDYECESPRDWDNLWTWATSPKAGYSDVDFRGTKEQNFRDRTYHNADDYIDGNGKIYKDFAKDNLIVKLYLYRHSGDYIYSSRTTDTPCNVHCPWDSGCMGFAFVSKEAVRKGFGTHIWKEVDGKTIDVGVPLKRITKKVLEKAYALLEGEIKAMNMANNGEVYGFKVVNMQTDEEDSCWGYYCDGRKEIAETAEEFIKDFLPDDAITKEIAREAAQALVA